MKRLPLAALAILILCVLTWIAIGSRRSPDDRLADFARSSTGKERCRALAPLPDRSAVEAALEAAWQAVRLTETTGDIPLGGAH